MPMKKVMVLPLVVEEPALKAATVPIAVTTAEVSHARVTAVSRMLPLLAEVVAKKVARLVPNVAVSTLMLSTNGRSVTTTQLQPLARVVVVLPVMMVYPFFQRFFTKGIMIGAVKG